MGWQGLALYFGGFLVLFYLLIILPRQRQEKKHHELVENLKPHDKVVSIGGLCGEVKKVKEKTVILKVSEGVELEILKSAIAYKQD